MMWLPFFLSVLATPAHAADAQTLDLEVERTPRAVLEERQLVLSGLWTFATLNYLYCDVIGLMDANMLRKYQSGTVDGLKISEGFLVGATLFMQVPMSMVFLSYGLNPKASRIANISAGTLMTAVQTATLFVGKPTPYYLTSSIIEIATTTFITAYAWRGLRPPRVLPTADVRRDTVVLGLRFTLG
jgi:hypothetical protein